MAKNYNQWDLDYDQLLFVISGFYLLVEKCDAMRFVFALDLAGIIFQIGFHTDVLKLIQKSLSSTPGNLLYLTFSNLLLDFWPIIKPGISRLSSF